MNAEMDGKAFAAAWADAWNRRDVEAVLAHFADNAVFTSPLAAELLPDTGGVIRGKPALRCYWTQALERNLDLRFTIEAVHQGIAMLAITYRNQRNASIVEVMLFEGGQVHEGHVGHSCRPNQF